MSQTGPKSHDLAESDLEFLAATAAPEVADKGRLKQLLAEDEDFRTAFIEDDRTVRKVIVDRDVFLRISPPLYFEILLRRARKDLTHAGHTIERGGLGKVAVFDAREVVDLLSRQDVLLYLADMLSSFIRTESYTLYFRDREGAWRKDTFNDMDIDALRRLSESVGEEHRLAFYKRIADVCLFVLGVFPEQVQRFHRHPFAGETRSPAGGRTWRSPEAFMEEGRRFYRMAAEHPAARTLEVSETFRLIHDNFLAAKKPLNVIADRYIHHQKHNLFGS